MVWSAEVRAFMRDWDSEAVVWRARGRVGRAVVVERADFSLETEGG